MPELFGEATLLPSSAVVADLLAACVAAVTADPECGVGGTLGVLKVEAAADQPEEPRKRPFQKLERPAVALWGEIGQVGIPVLCGVNTDTIRIHVQVVVENADNRTGRATALAIQHRVMVLLQAAKHTGDQFVSGYELNPYVDGNAPGEPRLAKKSATLFISESTSDFGVLWREVI